MNGSGGRSKSKRVLLPSEPSDRPLRRLTTSAGLTKVYTVHREVAPSASETDHHPQIRSRRPWGEERNYTSSIPYFLLTALFYMFLYITVHLHLIASLSASSFSAGFVEQNVVGGSGCLV